jgi:hypothetical protein
MLFGTATPEEDFAVGLLIFIFIFAVGTILWRVRRLPDPSDKACDVCGAEPDEECDPWTHNGV